MKPSLLSVNYIAILFFFRAITAIYHNIIPYGNNGTLAISGCQLQARLHTFKLPGQQVAQPPLQQRGDAPHEEEPHSPARGPEATAWTFTHWSLGEGGEH